MSEKPTNQNITVKLVKGTSQQEEDIVLREQEFPLYTHNKIHVTNIEHEFKIKFGLLFWV